jgi:hypothetical protein
MRKPRPGRDQKGKEADGPSVPEPFAGILGHLPEPVRGNGEYQRQPSNSLLLGIEIAKVRTDFPAAHTSNPVPLVQQPGADGSSFGLPPSIAELARAS